jgi:hypothetical protein
MVRPPIIGLRDVCLIQDRTGTDLSFNLCHDPFHYSFRYTWTSWPPFQNNYRSYFHNTPFNTRVCYTPDQAVLAFQVTVSRIVIVFGRYQKQLCAFLSIMESINCALIADQIKSRTFFSHKNVVLRFLNMWMSYNWHCKPMSKDYYTRISRHYLADTRCWFISLVIVN